MSDRSQRRAVSTSTPPTAADLKRSFFASRAPAASSQTGGQRRSSSGVPAASALPPHMQRVVRQHHAPGAGGALSPPQQTFGGSLESSSGLSKSLNDLDVNTGRLKEDNSLLHLKDEQRRLAQDVVEKKRTMVRLQKISEELSILLQQHQHLQDAANKRERLGQTMRQRLEERCHKLEGTNRQLTGHLEQERIHPGSTHVQAREDMKEDLARRDQLIRSLQSQHNTCTTDVEQLQQQHTRLQQDMAWLKVLEEAAVDTEGKLKRLDEELSASAHITNRLPELEAQFQTLTSSSKQRRSEHKLIAQHLRTQLSELGGQLQAAGNELLPFKLSLPKSIFLDLEQLVMQRDQHINIMSEEMLRWRQLYMDELRESSALGEVESTGSSTPSMQSSRTGDSPSLSKRLGVNAMSTASQSSSTTLSSQPPANTAANQQQERHTQDLRTALQHQLQLEAGLKTLEHLIAERELELLDVQQSASAFERDTAGGSKFGLATPGKLSGLATPSSVLSNPVVPGQALRRRWASIGSQPHSNGLLSASEWEYSASASSSPIKTGPDGRDAPFLPFPSVKPNGGLSDKAALILQLQDESMV